MLILISNWNKTSLFQPEWKKCEVNHFCTERRVRICQRNATDWKLMFSTLQKLAHVQTSWCLPLTPQRFRDLKFWGSRRFHACPRSFAQANPQWNGVCTVSVSDLAQYFLKKKKKKSVWLLSSTNWNTFLLFCHSAVTIIERPPKFGGLLTENAQGCLC